MDVQMTCSYKKLDGCVDRHGPIKKLYGCVDRHDAINVMDVQIDMIL